MTMRIGSAIALATFVLLPDVSAEDAYISSVRVEGPAPSVLLETRAGESFDPEALRRDVRLLWRLGNYSAVEVRREFTSEGSAIVFVLDPRPRFALREVRFEPPSAKRDLSGRPPPWVDEQTARTLARALAADLRRKGFVDAKVRGRVNPIGPAEADLVLFVVTGERRRVKRIEVTGISREQAKRLQRKATELSRRTLIPGLLSLSRAFSAERLAHDLRNMKAGLVEQGRLAGSIHAEAMPADGHERKMAIRFDVVLGPVFHVRRADVHTASSSEDPVEVKGGRFPAPDLCAQLRLARRETESEGRLGFAAWLEVRSADVDPDSGARAVTLTAASRADAPVTVRRIDFTGETSLRGSTVRRTLRLEESDVLDLGLLRRDLNRLSRLEALQPITLDHVEITPLGDGRADIRIPLQPRKARRWSISGPLGPARLFGPFDAWIETRLPPWARGLFEASTYSAGIWFAGLPQLVVGAEGWEWKTPLKPEFVVRRGLMPGRPWTSGWMWTPQTSSRTNAATNVVARTRALLSKAVSGGEAQTTLVVPVVGEGVDGELLCRDPNSWSDRFREVARFLTGI